VTFLDDLISHPGTYVGIDTVAGLDSRGAARIVVTPLPGGAGVTLDYEVFNPSSPDRLRGHVERAVLARTHGGGLVMVTAHDHADSVQILHETEPGTFEVGAEGSPFPLKVVVSVPEPGRLRHVWWYGRPGGEAVERDVTEAELQS
jgi:hypothetical protein